MKKYLFGKKITSLYCLLVTLNPESLKSMPPHRLMVKKDRAVIVPSVVSTDECKPAVRPLNTHSVSVVFYGYHISSCTYQRKVETDFEVIKNSTASLQYRWRALNDFATSFNIEKHSFNCSFFTVQLL